MEALEDLGEGQLVPAACTGKAFEKWGGYENYFVAVGEELRGFVKDCGVYD